MRWEKTPERRQSEPHAIYYVLISSKGTSARNTFVPKTILTVSSVELTCCLVTEFKIRI